MDAGVISFSVILLILGSAASSTVQGQSLQKIKDAKNNYSCDPTNTEPQHLSVLSHYINWHAGSHPEETQKRFPDGFYWTTDYTPEDEPGDHELSVRLQSFLPNPDISTISTLAAAWGQGPNLSGVHDDNTATGMHHFLHNETNGSWMAKMPYEDLLSQGPSHIIQKKDLFILGSMIASTESSLPFNLHKTIKASNMKPSKSLIGRVFCSSCFPARSVLVTEDALFYSNDAFSTSSPLGLELVPPVEEDTVVTSLAMDDYHMFIVTGGSVYMSSLLNELSFFKRISLPVGGIVGVTSRPICYKPLLPSPKNSLAFAWNPTSVLKIVVFGNSEALVTLIDIEAILNIHPGSVLAEVVQAGQPNSIYLVLKSHVWTIIECLVLESTVRNCTQISIPEQISNVPELNIEILNAALPSLLLWSGRIVIQIDGEEHHQYALSSGMQRVYLSPERMAWIMHFSDDTLQYGRLHYKEMVAIKTPDPVADASFFLHFLSDFDVRNVRWQSKDALAVEVYPLQVELNKVTLEEDSIVPFSRFIGPLRTFNIIQLESLQDSFYMEFTVVYPRESDFDFTVTPNFNNLSLDLETERSISTQRVTSHIVLHAMEFKLKMIADCKQSPEKCQTGFAALEVRAHSGNESVSSLMQEHSQVFFINMTCPAGMNIRLGNIRNCTEYPDHCYIRMREDDFLDLRFHLYKYDEYISVITDDVILTELNGRSGFVLHNINLMKKICYQCSQFHEAESAAVLMLQTMGSACPCEANSENENEWVGNISFKYAVASTSEKNNFDFNAKVLSRSLCNLNVDFTVELVPEPFLPFLLWEYIFIVVFIAATLIGLCVSYHNYVKHMRLNRQMRRQAQ